VPHPFPGLMLREDEQALDMLCDLLAEGTITQANINTWPLLDRLRAGGRPSGLVMAKGARAVNVLGDPR